MNLSWRLYAACRVILDEDGRELDECERANLFHPTEDVRKINGRADRAKVICEGCSVRSECLDDALMTEWDSENPQGIRGGMTGRERLEERFRREHSA